MTRSKLREHLFKLVYLDAFNTSDEMPEQVELYLQDASGDDEESDGNKISDKDREFLKMRWAAVASKLDEIDALLNSTARGWKTSRFPSCDLAILRVAVYEMVYDDSIPVGVSINEAVELAKKYGGNESPSFINGVLGQIAKNLPEKEEAAKNEK